MKLLSCKIECYFNIEASDVAHHSWLFVIYMDIYVTIELWSRNPKFKEVLKNVLITERNNENLKFMISSSLTIPVIKMYFEPN